jgi:hypothetical protein
VWSALLTPPSECPVNASSFDDGTRARWAGGEECYT